MTAIDWNKPVQTKDGRKVRLLCKDGPNYLWPVIGLVAGKEHPDRWNALGTHDNPHGWDHLDLINVPEKHELWVNVCKDMDGVAYGTVHISREQANRYHLHTRIACVRIEFEEGEGIS